VNLIHGIDTQPEPFGSDPVKPARRNPAQFQWMSTTMRILLVEDDRDLSSRVAASLRSENFVVDIVVNGEDAQHAGLTEIFDVAVLDLGLPKIDGVSVLRSWREGSRSFPVLVLTARDGWPDKVAAFRAGADDFLTKPFRVEELILRLRALVRRATGHAASRIKSGDLTFDAQLGTFELEGLPLKLTAFEWRVLSCLILRKESTVDRRELIERVYEGDADVDSNSIEVIVARLRRKIGSDRIRTTRGRGYMLTEL
jgi:DNA-binding response OmpR family regulator